VPVELPVAVLPSAALVAVVVRLPEPVAALAPLVADMAAGPLLVAALWEAEPPD